MPNGTTIVTCVESGPLEAEVLMLAESVRVFGGRQSNVDFVAVKPRRGPSISLHTKNEFRRLSVEFVDAKLNTDFDWWNNANKSFAMAQLEDRVSTPNITWMDSDMLVLHPPDDFVITTDALFVARAGESYLGSDGSDQNAPYWEKLCELEKLDFEKFPTIISFPERKQIRAYWHGGVYTYPTTAQLGKEHNRILKKLLSSRIGSRYAGAYHQDQVSMALAVQKLRLNHAEYSPDMNFNLNKRAKAQADLLPITSVKILHYHDSLFGPGLAWSYQYLEQLPRDRQELINKYTPLNANASYLARVQRKFLNILRQRKVNDFTERVQLY